MVGAFLEVEPLARQPLANVDRALGLRMDLAAVPNGGRVECVEGVIHRIINVQGSLLVEREVVLPGVDPGFRKPRAGFRRGPSPRIMQADVPGPRAAHGEAAQHDAVGIDVVPLTLRRQDFEYVRIYGPAVRAYESAEDLRHIEILHRYN